MDERIRGAIKGQEGAMLGLYEEHKKQVVCLCRALLVEEEAVRESVPAIFHKVWEELLAGRIDTEENFSEILIRRTVMYCKSVELKKNNRAFRLPIGSNFSAFTFDVRKMDFEGSACRIVTGNLPALHRFIYVLHTAAGYSAESIAKLFNAKAKHIEIALESEAANIERISALAEQKGKSARFITAEAFHEELLAWRSDAELPENVDEGIRAHIRTLCEPIKKREMRKKMWMVAICGTLVVLMIYIIAAIIIFNGKRDPNVDLDNADPGKVTYTATEEVSTETEGAAEDETSEYSTEFAGVEQAITTTSAVGSEITATYFADIELEDYGTITLALDGTSAPITVSNFVKLAKEGFYDGLTFHRIMEGFVMQGGDPNGDGTGGSEETIKGEFTSNGVDNPLSHTRGAVSMARAADYDGASSQFFIVHEDNTQLDGDYAVFGYVTEGIEVVDAVCGGAEPTDGNGTIPAEAQPVIKTIIIRDTAE